MAKTELFVENVDLRLKPTPPHSNDSLVHRTIGDLHANALKFLFFLINEGILETSKDNYDAFIDCYLQPDADHLKKMKEIVQNLKVKKNNILVRLLGDELADRGENDLFVLLILDKLHQEKIQVEILSSNHGVEFIKPYEAKAAFHSPLIGFGGQSKSMDNLELYIQKGLIAREEVEALVRRAYLPKLKLISYSINRSFKGIRIYSHAPIDLSVIRQIASKFSISYQDKTIYELAQTIDGINAHFQKNYVEQGKVNVLFNDIGNKSNPFTMLIWNRDYQKINRLSKNHDYDVYYSHGHDAKPNLATHVCNLDNQLGKGHIMQGKYNILRTAGIMHPNAQKEVYLDHLNSLALKCEEFEHKMNDNPKFLQPYREALSLYHSLKKNLDLFEENKDYELFKEDSLQAIEKAKPVLSKHRDYKYLLVNLALAIAGLGVFYALASLINYAVNGHFLFFSKTKSLLILEQLEKDIHSFKNSPATFFAEKKTKKVKQAHEIKEIFIYDFDHTITQKHTFSFASLPKFNNSEFNKVDAISNLKQNLTLQHDAENLSMIASYHNNPDFIANYVSVHLGQELVKQETILDHDFPNLAINVYHVSGGDRPFYIAYIPKQGLEFQTALQTLAGKNQHINFLRNVLFQRQEIPSPTTAVHFYDDDRKNYQQAQGLANVTCHLVNASDSKFSIVETSQQTVDYSSMQVIKF